MSDKQDQGRPTPFGGEELKKKKSSRKGGSKKYFVLIALLVVAGLLFGGAYVLQNMPDQTELTEPAATEDNSVDLSILKAEQADVRSIQVENEAGKYTLLYNDEDKSFELEGQPSFELNASVPSSMVNYAGSLNAVEIIDEDAQNLAEFGLDKPGVKATINYKNGTSKVLNFGQKMPTGSTYYLTEGDSKKVVLVNGSVYNAFATALNDLHTIPQLNLNAETIDGFRVERKGQDFIQIRTNNSELVDDLSVNSSMIEQPIVYQAHQDRTQQVKESLVAMQISGYAGQITDGTDYGFEEPSAKITVFSTIPVETEAIDEAATQEPTQETTQTSEVFLELGDTNDENQVYVRLDNSDAVYLMDKSLFGFLEQVTVPNLIDPFINLVNIVKVDGLTIETQTDTYTMSITREPQLDEDGKVILDDAGKEKILETYMFNENMTQDKLFKKFYQVVIGTLADKYVDEDPGTGEVVLRITYDLNVAPNSLTVEYMEYDQDYYIARKNDRAQFLIKKSKVQEIIDTAEQYKQGAFTLE